MLTILISAIVCAVWAAISLTEKWDTAGKSVIFGLIGCLIGLVAGVAIAHMLPSHNAVQVDHIQIVSLNDGRGISGRTYMLGAGEIKDEMKFTFYTKENGFYKLNNVPADKSRIRYTEDVNRVIIKKIVPSDKWYNWFSLSTYWGEKTYDFDIPEGSITENFTLDAQ